MRLIMIKEFRGPIIAELVHIKGNMLYMPSLLELNILYPGYAIGIKKHLTN